MLCGSGVQPGEHEIYLFLLLVKIAAHPILRLALNIVLSQERSLTLALPGIQDDTYSNLTSLRYLVFLNILITRVPEDGIFLNIKPSSLLLSGYLVNWFTGYLFNRLS
jgi:hypothetical protein